MNYSNNLLFKIDEYIEQMPSLPISVSKVMKVCNNVNADPVDLFHVISLDPVLTGKVLKLVNSAYYGLTNHVTSLVRAIIMLGINTVKNLAISAAILASLPKNKIHHGMNMDKFWLHCLCVGVTAKLLAVKQGVDSKLHEEYFVAGLLHDIGKIPLNAVLTADYVPELSGLVSEQKPFYAVEKESLKITHCETGELIAKAWQLEGPIADVIVCHHDISMYKGENTKILNNIAIANYFSSLFEVGFAGEKNPVKPEKEVWNAAGISENVFEEIKQNVLKETEKAKVFLTC